MDATSHEAAILKHHLDLSSRVWEVFGGLAGRVVLVPHVDAPTPLLGGLLSKMTTAVGGILLSESIIGFIWLDLPTMLFAIAMVFGGIV